MNHLNLDDPVLAKLVRAEEVRLETTLNLIAAENYMPPGIFETMGSVLGIKTIEGYPGKRFHAGCSVVDEVEDLAISRAKELFGAEHVNVQPHSGTSANMAVYFSVLELGDPILAMSLPHGGHLSHGHRASITSRCFSFTHYGLDPETERIDYDLVRDQAIKTRPKMLVAGASSYPRLIDYKILSDIAAEVGAMFLSDIAHLAGLVAAGVIPSPVPHSDFVTFTTYMTLRGGRGGVLLCKEKYAKDVNSAVFPGCQGTSPVNNIAAKALAFKLAREPEFTAIQAGTLRNAKTLAGSLAGKGYRLVTGGTENHQVLLDLTSQGINGGMAEKVLEDVGLVTNRNVVPGDAAHPGRVSGLRLGTGALASRGLGSREMEIIGNLMDRALKGHDRPDLLEGIRSEVQALCAEFSLYR